MEGGAWLEEGGRWRDILGGYVLLRPVLLLLCPLLPRALLTLTYIVSICNHEQTKPLLPLRYFWPSDDDTSTMANSTVGDDGQSG